MASLTHLLLFPILFLQTSSWNRSFPYQAALFIDGQKFCSGALIFDKFVVTTADCLVDAFEVSVVLGSVDLLKFSDLEKTVLANEFFLRDNFLAKENDIALIKLPFAVQLTEYINVVGLPPDSSLNLAQIDEPVTFYTVTGWSGSKNNTKTLTGQLNGVPILINDCTVSDGGGSDDYLIHSKQLQFLCGFESFEKIEDFGSPLVANSDTLIGLLVSYYDTPNGFEYIRIAPHLNWIVETVVLNP